MRTFKQLLMRACAIAITLSIIQFASAQVLSTQVLSAQPLSTQAWESLNPGAGGQIQAVVLDPIRPNHAFVLSDVDGVYHTADGGSSWDYLSNGLAGTNALDLAYDPRNASRVYLGTTVGLHTSTNGGQTWKLQPNTTRSANPELLTKKGDRAELAIGNVMVDPGNTERVMAGVGNKRESTIGQATVFRSTNGGNSFQAVRFGPQSATNKSILQLAYDTRQRQVFAATAESGLWQGNNFGAPAQWSKVAHPSNTTDRVESVAVAKDGTLYAAFGRPNAAGTALFVSRNQGDSWQSLGQPGPDDLDPAKPKLENQDSTPMGDRYAFRNLVIDPRSTQNCHSLLTATGNDRTGLYELTVTWNNNTPTTAWERVLFYESRKGTNAPTYDIGWEGGVYGNRPRPLAFQYSPDRWGNRSLWTTGDQTLFKVDNATKENATTWRNHWQAIYTSAPQSTFSDVVFNVATNHNRVFTGRSIETYSGTGWQSTVDTDVSRYGDVIIRSGADHGVTLSWDNGRSWEDSSNPRRAKSQANAVVSQGGNVYLLAHYSATQDFGANKTNGELWAAKINPAKPKPVQWYFMAGGQNNEPFEPPLGLGVALSSANSSPARSNAKVYTNIVSDPSVPGRVYISTQTQGAYVIPDIGKLYDQRVSLFPPPNPNTASPIASMFDFPRIANSPNANEYEGSMVLDPNDNSSLYIADRGVLYKGDRDDNTGTNLLDRSWNWQQILTSDQLMTFDAWDRNGTTVLAAATQQNGQWETKFSADAGSTWQTLIDIDELKAARTPAFDFSEVEPIIFAVAGRNSEVYLSVQTLAPTNLGYGLFRADLSGSAISKVTDVTGNLPFPKSFRTKIITDPVTNETHLYMASWGAGTWRLLIT